MKSTTFRSIAISIIVCLLWQPLASALTIPITDDACVITATGHTGHNYGGSTNLSVSSAASDTRHSYLHIKIEDYVASGVTSAQITHAWLHLYVNSVATPGSYAVYKAAASWNEGKFVVGTTSSTDITWSNKPGYTGSPIATVYIDTPNKFDYTSVEITQQVKDWLDTPSTNYGLVLVPSGTVNIDFDSKENNTDGGTGPFLDIEVSSTNASLTAIAGGTWSGASSISTLGTITTGTWNGSTISIASGGTGATTTGGARSNLGLAIGSNVQAWSANLDDLADGSLTGSKVGSGISAGNITTGTLSIGNGGTGSTTGSITGSGALTFTSGGTNTSVTLTPTGTGLVVLSSDATINGLTFGRGKGGISTNLAAGSSALGAVTTGDWNTAIGNGALSLITTGSYNTATGIYALANNTAYSNTANGAQALTSNTTGYENNAFGAFALHDNTTGYRNTAMGREALYSNTIGFGNVAYGAGALHSNTEGNANVAVGPAALYSHTTGFSNVAIGDIALWANTTSSQNIGIGMAAGSFQADSSTWLVPGGGGIYIGAYTKGVSNGENSAIVIGYQAQGEGSGKTVIGNVNTTSTHLYGTLVVGGGTTAPELRILEASGNGTNYTGFVAPALAANVVYTLPSADGASGQVLSTNGTGGLSWVAMASNISGNAATATALQTSRTINGVAFDGTSNITVNAAAGGLTGATLNSGVISSSLTSLGTVTSGTWQATAVADSYIASASTWHAKQDALTFGAGLTNTTGTITIGGGAITNSMLAGGIDLTSKVSGALPAANGGTGQTSVLASADAFDAKGSDLASASTTDLSTATGVFVNVTGTATIATLGTAPAGVRRWVRFTGAGTITYHATSLILPGAADLTRAAGDCAIFESLGSGNWRCLFYQRAEGAPIGLRIQPQGDVAMDFHAGPTP